jgi:hypothetical protein
MVVFGMALALVLLLSAEASAQGRRMNRRRPVNPDPTNSNPAAHHGDGEVQGLFALSQGTKPMSNVVLANPDLAGVSLRAKWEDMEPQEHQMTSIFDSEIARAKKAGKEVMIRVDPSRAPDWLYKSGAKAFVFTDANPHHKTAGETKQMPLPWDRVYLDKWTAFIKALGRRYDKDKTVVLVQMAGPNKGGGEMHLPATPGDKTHWEQIGYSKEKLVAAYKTVIDAYAEAFPDKPLALNVSDAVFHDNAVEDIVSYASRKLGGRFCIQHNALAAKTNENGFRIHKLVRQYEGKATVGFQLLCAATSKGRFTEGGQRFGGTLKEAFDIGLRAGASYFEIYTVDLENQAAARDIHGLAVNLSK